MIAFVGCDKIGGAVSDPEGTFIVQLRNDGKYYGFSDESYNLIGITEANNLSVFAFGNTHGLAHVGEGQLSNIDTNTLPTRWGRDYAALVGHLYVARFLDVHGEDYYYGIRVESTVVGTNNGIIGFVVKYCRFIPGEGWY